MTASKRARARIASEPGWAEAIAAVVDEAPIPTADQVATLRAMGLGVALTSGIEGRAAA